MKKIKDLKKGDMFKFNKQMEQVFLPKDMFGEDFVVTEVKKYWVITSNFVNGKRHLISRLNWGNAEVQLSK